MKFSLLTSLFAITSIGIAAPSTLKKRVCETGTGAVDVCCGDKDINCRSYSNCLLHCNPVGVPGEGGVLGCILGKILCRMYTMFLRLRFLPSLQGHLPWGAGVLSVKGASLKLCHSLSQAALDIVHQLVFLVYILLYSLSLSLPLVSIHPMSTSLW